MQQSLAPSRCTLMCCLNFPLSSSTHHHLYLMSADWALLECRTSHLMSSVLPGMQPLFTQHKHHCWNPQAYDVTCNGSNHTGNGPNLKTIMSQCTVKPVLQSKFLISFWHLFNNFLMASCCNWPIKMQGLWEVELSIVGTWHLATPPPPVLAFWLTSLKDSHQKVHKVDKN